MEKCVMCFEKFDHKGKERNSCIGCLDIGNKWKFLYKKYFSMVVSDVKETFEIILKSFSFFSPK